jgi:hypothetical protein
MRSALSYDAVWRRPQGVLVTSPPCRARPALRAATQLVGRSSRVRWVDTGGAQRGLGSTREDERPDRTGSTRPAFRRSIFVGDRWKIFTFLLFWGAKMADPGGK